MADDRYSRAQSILIAERDGVLTRTSQELCGKLGDEVDQAAW
jgi:hypothetical protein